MVSRNELCPCGSGKKHKNCCGASAASRSTRGLMLLTIPLALLAGVGIYSAMNGSEGPASAVSSFAPSQAGTAPAGKVWSAEHGHWHDAEAAPVSIPRPAANAFEPQPPASQPEPAATPGSPQPGPAPAGKVWSTQHGHWHDITPQSQSPIQIEMADGAPGSAVQSSGSEIRIDANSLPGAQPARSVPQPAGAVPEGKVWSPAHGHWHDANAPQLPVRMGTVNQPSEPVLQAPGPTPDGMVWSPEHGHFHEAPNTSGPRVEPQPTPTTTNPNR